VRGEAVRAPLELAVAEALAFERRRVGLRRAPRLRLDQPVQDSS
jgi:hypothetical protein